MASQGSSWDEQRRMESETVSERQKEKQDDRELHIREDRDRRHSETGELWPSIQRHVLLALPRFDIHIQFKRET